jgi:hypothetical protein
MTDDGWESRMSARAYERDRTRVERERGIPDPVDPPDDGTCRDCYEWRYYPVGQRHFGQAWWRTCEHDGSRCDHPHHLEEVWIA